MIRLAGWLIIGAMVVSVAVALIGYAADQEARTQERVIYVHNGVTLDCARVVRDGDVFLEDCERNR
jgi:hypothetical protein